MGNVFHMYLDIQDTTSVIYYVGAEHAITTAAFPVAFDRGVSARQAGLPQPPPAPRNQFGTRAAAQASGFGTSLGGIRGGTVHC
jgi:hypothetical protein